MRGKVGLWFFLLSVYFFLFYFSYGNDEDIVKFRFFKFFGFIECVLFMNIYDYVIFGFRVEVVFLLNSGG